MVEINEPEENKNDSLRDLWDGVKHINVRIIRFSEEDVKEAEKNEKRWQEYTEELYKQGLNHLDNHIGVITHLEPEILECKVKWTLGNITMTKSSGGNGIPAELLQILKDDTV